MRISSLYSEINGSDSFFLFLIFIKRFRLMCQKCIPTLPTHQKFLHSGLIKYLTGFQLICSFLIIKIAEKAIK